MQVYIEKGAQSVEVSFEELPAISQTKVIEYGLKQLLNDACAPVKLRGADEGKIDGLRSEAMGLVAKRLDNLKAGVLRSTRVAGGGDPVAREAFKIALGKVQKAKGFLAWVAKNGLKVTDKAYTDKARELAKRLASREDIVALAQANVAAAAEIEVDVDI